ncbi:hypothetical protein RND81_13G029600 [Saponaria officinalis]|uniref:Hydrophobic seed protein domain-containing protein n=1 Tax=Saponaria officinalis TaxID=3572 RepID=A0AAW1GTE9_SAPOF
MATSKPIATLIILLNLAMFTFVSTTAACPNLSACLNIADSLLNVQLGSQASTNCCQLIGGLVSAEARLCLCTSLQTTFLGSLLASVLNLTDGLPLIGGLLPILGHLPLIGSLPLNVLDQEILALFNACGFDATKFKCSS